MMLSTDAKEFVPGRQEHPGTAAIAEFSTRISAQESTGYKVSFAALRVIDELVVGTANVSTLHPRELLRSSTGHGISMIARALILEDLFAQRSLDVVFIQEGRLQGDAVHPG